MLADEIARLAGADRDALLAPLLDDPAGRRWLRGALLPALATDAAEALAIRLLTYRGDFAREHRDATTPAVIARLPLATLHAEAPALADGNAATALWERLSQDGTETVLAAARRVLQEGSPAAREATVYVLLLDPYDPLSLTGPARISLLDLALDDPDDEIRGLAAEVAAEEAPDLLQRRGAEALRDPSQRVRMAAWYIAFATDPEAAAANAERMIGDEDAPLPARRSALLALGESLPTARIEPLLAALVVHPNAELAEDAAQLLWSRHRSPVIATAAAESPHPAVREIAQRLLDPTRGSPLAGGFRPGADAQGYDFYERLFRS